MVNKATATNDDLREISRASEDVFRRVEQKKRENTRTTEQDVLFKRIERQKNEALGKKQRADLTGETQKNVLTGKGNVVDFLEYRAKKLGQIEKQLRDQEKPLDIDSGRSEETKTTVTNESSDEKTELGLVLERVSQKKAEELEGNNEFKEKLEEKLTEIVVGGDLKTEDEKITEIKEIISENTETEGVPAEIAAKEISLELNRVKESHQEEIISTERKNLAKEFEEETKKKNKLSKEEVESVKKIGETMAEVVYGDSVISDKDLALENTQGVSVGKIKNAQREIQVIVGLLDKTPEQVKNIRNEYKNFKETNKIDLPFNKIVQLAAFDRVLNSLEDQRIGPVFDLVHQGSWLQKIKGLGNNRVIGSSGGFVMMIGSQPIRDFAQNSIGMLVSSDFYGGFRNVLSGIVNGGVKMANIGSKIGGSLGLAAGATNPVGLAVLGGKALLGKITGGLKSLGLDVLGKAKNGAESGGNKALGWLMGGLGAVGSISGLITAIAPQLLIVLGVSVLGISFLTMSYTQTESPTVPPTTESTETSNTTDTETGTGSETSGGTSINMSYQEMSQPIDMSKIKKRMDKSEYKYKSNGDIDFSYIGPLLPTKGTHKRSDIIKAAYALLGIPYFMTGGHGTIADGVSSKWGNKITPSCTYGNCGRAYMGLDCSGFVRWVYKYVTGEVVGNRAADIYANSRHINKTEMKPGDIGYMEGHIGMFFGKGTDGQYYFIHDAGRSSKAGPQSLGGVYISAAKFYKFGVVNVSLLDE